MIIINQLCDIQISSLYLNDQKEKSVKINLKKKKKKMKKKKDKINIKNYGKLLLKKVVVHKSFVSDLKHSQGKNSLKFLRSKTHELIN